jgi:hypothetical protein
MSEGRVRTFAVVVLALLLTPFAAQSTDAQEASRSRIEGALSNIATLVRPGRDGFATIWDGNKYIQCRRLPEQTFRCEAAGALMQPSLGRVLRPERIARLVELGWRLDPSFGNYVQVFPATQPIRDIAGHILQSLKDGYDADLTDLEVQTDWIRSEPCPPRNGPGQNLAGMVNDAPAMARHSVRGCAYKPLPGDEPTPVIRTKADLINVYGPRVAGEVQRLRVNVDAQKFLYFVIETGGGYVQCGTQPPRAVYCEAQSAESWPVLSRILSADRIARLHAAGFADPGRTPNYWKSYLLDQSSDGAIAEELLTILHEVYGYDGSPALEFKSEKGSG